jgi:hypothetical protein
LQRETDSYFKTWGAAMSGFYQSRSLVTSIFLLHPMYVVSFGASKQILKTKVSIKLSIIDPFRLQKARVTAVHEDINVLVKNRLHNRRAGLTCTCRFSKGENVQQSRRNGSAQEEQNRIGK